MKTKVSRPILAGMLVGLLLIMLVGVLNRDELVQLTDPRKLGLAIAAWVLSVLWVIVMMARRPDIQ
jgi:hypothetical protein